MNLATFPWLWRLSRATIVFMGIRAVLIQIILTYYRSADSFVRRFDFDHFPKYDRFGNPVVCQLVSDRCFTKYGSINSVQHKQAVILLFIHIYIRASFLPIKILASGCQVFAPPIIRSNR